MQITKLRETSTAVDPLLQNYLDAKAAADRANANLKVATEGLLAEMELKHMKSTAVERDGVRTQVTYVKRETTEIDEKGLRRALRAKTFDKYTKRVLDRKAMEQAMEAGDVDPMVVAPFVTLKESSPYLKFTVKDVNDE